MADWIPGFDYAPATRSGGSYAVDVADKLVLHTTEGNSIAGAIGAYSNAGSWPHFTVDPLRRHKVQHLPVNRAAFALYNYSSTPMETNRAGDVIQVEIVGFAGSTHTYSEEWYRWLAQEVVRPICEAVGIPNRCTRFYGSYEGYVLASEDWVGRMQMAEFYAYSGICGHQNVGDGNDHWDPGGLDAEKLLGYGFGGGEIYDPVTNSSWTVGGGAVGNFGHQRNEDDELMGAQADDIIQRLQRMEVFLGAAFGGSVEVYEVPGGGGQWRTAPLVNGAPTRGGTAMPILTALIYEAASFTRVHKTPAPAGAPQVDVNAVADAVIAKLGKVLAR